MKTENISFNREKTYFNFNQIGITNNIILSV